MRPIIKIFVFSWMGLILFFVPLLAEQQGSEFSPQVFKGMQVIMDDFLVNNDSIFSIQREPSMAVDGAGNFVIVWEDYRNGDGDIYYQKYDSSGTPLSSDSRVNTDFGTASQKYPAIAIDYSGNFIIVWEVSRNGYQGDIFAQRYDSSGDPLGSNFKVNNDSGDTYESAPEIAIDGSGNFIITWSDSRNGYDFDIFAQRYNSSGIPLGSNFRVNDDTGGTEQAVPSLTADVSGNFIITWTDKRNGGYDIYAQRFDSSGAPLGFNFKVNDDTGAAQQWLCDIGSDNSGNFVVTWVDLRHGNYNIYAQKYNSSGIPLDSNFEVNDAIAGQKIFPAITVYAAGSFVITWSGQSIKWDIFAQRYDSTCTPIGSNFEVNDKAGSAGKGGPAISTRSDGNFIITWSDNRNGNPNIYAQRYNISGDPVGHNFKVNVDVNSDQEYPAVSVDNHGNFVITWMDERNGNRDIYAQRYDYLGTLLGSNFQVNDDTGNAWQESPAIATDGSGNFIITWEDTRDDNWDIYAQRYSSSGFPLGVNFKVHNTGTAWRWFPDVAADDSGNFIIAWHDYRNGTYNADIYAQRYDLDGDTLSSNFKVNDDTGTGWQGFPAVAMDKFSNFIITWMDDRQGDYDIYAQRYDSLGNPLSSNFRANDDDGFEFQAYPVIGMDSNGSFVITWQDSRSNHPDIYGQRYDSSGNPLGFNFKANDDDGNNYQGYPAVTMDGSGNFIITWTDSRNGDYDVYAQRCNSSGNPVGDNYLVPNSQYSSFKQLSPAVASNRSNIYFTWMDNRRDKGWDIYAKVVDWNWTEIGEEEVVGLPNRFELAQNYPNPFNPSTTIPFKAGSGEHIARSSIHTTLIIYNILGQKVRTLVDEEKLPANYSVIWDGKDYSGKDVASGIYFYQLKTKDCTYTKKMVLLR